MQERKNDKWLYEINPKGKLIDLNLKEIWRYRDLLFLFVKRDIVTVYKQTVLGPLWYLIQPLFTAITFTLIFNKVAGIKTDGVPPMLFNLAGITLWTYFKECLNVTSNTFRANVGLFGKVYFPRFIVPASKVISGLFKYGIQLFIFILFYLYFLFTGWDIGVGETLYLFPLVIITVVLIALGSGMVLSALTTKYRDLSILIGFGLQLLMYISAVMYPLEIIKEKLPKYYWLVEYNPIAQIIESARHMLINTGNANVAGLLWSFGFGVVIFFVGLIIFNRTEKTFIDTV
jgi:lipopolysaccharide transport system permease protein